MAVAKVSMLKRLRKVSVTEPLAPIATSPSYQPIPNGAFGFWIANRTSGVPGLKPLTVITSFSVKPGEVSTWTEAVACSAQPSGRPGSPRPAACPPGRDNAVQGGRRPFRRSTHPDFRERARQQRRADRLLATRHPGVGVGNGPRVVAGQEDERHAARDERVGDRVHALVAEVDVEHRAVEPLALGLDQGERVPDRARRSHHLGAAALELAREGGGDQVLVLNDEEATAAQRVGTWFSHASFLPGASRPAPRWRSAPRRRRARASSPRRAGKAARARSVRCRSPSAVAGHPPPSAPRPPATRSAPCARPPRRPS